MTTSDPNEVKVEVIAPQKGPQMRMCSSAAQIVIYGGQAGGGKSYGLSIDPLKDMAIWPGFRGIVFRKTLGAIQGSGSLWDVAVPIYRRVIGGRTRGFPHLEFRAKTGAVMKFAQIYNEKDLEAHQGPQYTFIGFDELCQFPEEHFWRLVARLRPPFGAPPEGASLRVRATCNPDPSSFVKQLISWWLDAKTGLPIPERDGVIRYVLRDGGKTHVAGSPRDLREIAPHCFIDKATKAPIPWREAVMTMTFIRSTLEDNPALLAANPQYRAFLNGLDPVTRRMWLDGSWLAVTAGEFFRRSTFPVVHAPPSPVTRTVRFWDLAGSKRRRSDFLAGVKLGLMQDGRSIVLDVINAKGTPAEHEATIAAAAKDDGRDVEIWIEEEKGASGQLLVDNWSRNLLRGYHVQGSPNGNEDKVTRAKLPSADASKAHVFVLAAEWNDEFLTQLEAFPTQGIKDDMVDGFTGAWHRLFGESEFAFASIST